jgi:membrane protein implicated in regulation of membrane protease activity
MTWTDFYLGCFVVGFVLSVFAFLGGHLHLPFHLLGSHGGAAHGLGHGVPHGSGHGRAATGHGGGISPFNFVSFTAFLAWFGGTGFLLTRYSRVWFVTGLIVAMAVGLLGGYIIYVFMAKVLMSPDAVLDPADFRMEGVLGYLSNPIREGGTGELIYTQEGTRRTCGARSDDGVAIAKGTEVIVTRYERGLAYVRTWDEMLSPKTNEEGNQ